MVVKVLKEVHFPNQGWLSSRAIGPQNSRMLLEVRGHSGQSSWAEGLLTVPENAVNINKEYDWSPTEIVLLPGVYQITEGQDKAGQRILRFYTVTDNPELILLAVDGYLVREASTSGVQIILEAEGHSRTGQNGDRWSLIAAPVGAVVAVEPYHSVGDPIYYRVSEKGIQELGATDAVLAPEEW